ncbi:hypothetical protein K7432_004759 [Basidiobolus ranarum]|uniref:Cyclin N-terminal domain-containing protein n=1 Tax=Basidiobolus ranarum TaxID=34480 RepID=A0ABR2W444_9FUNG
MFGVDFNKRLESPTNFTHDLAASQFATFAADVATFTWYPELDPMSSSASSVFRKHCQNMLLTTKVSSSVIILALKYIQRLKYLNGQLRGQPGSEIGIFTVALILANKYLDDKVLNKRMWSRVSGIPINELNRMELGFLAAVEYRLVVIKDDYFNWLKFLEHFITIRNQLHTKTVENILEPEETNDWSPDDSDIPMVDTPLEFNEPCQVRLNHKTKLLHTDNTHPLIS